MSPAAKSLFIYGFYILSLSLLLLFLSFYDIQAARAGLTPFLRWSVYTRGSVTLFFAAFVLLGFAGPMLILFGVVDLLAAIWTALALRSEKASTPPA
jgi:hypothetical protein